MFWDGDLCHVKGSPAPYPVLWFAIATPCPSPAPHSIDPCSPAGDGPGPVVPLRMAAAARLDGAGGGAGAGGGQAAAAERDVAPLLRPLRRLPRGAVAVVLVAADQWWLCWLGERRGNLQSRKKFFAGCIVSYFKLEILHF